MSDGANIHDNHRQRVREEFLKGGLDHFPPHKILEMLLFYTNRRKDTNELGHRLIDRFGTLSGVFDADIELLKEVDGIGPESAILIKFTAALFKAYAEDYASEHNTIVDCTAAKEYMRYKFLCESRECVHMAGLGNNGKVIYSDRAADGSPETVSLNVSDLVRAALRSGAVKVLIAHNHPNGFCNASYKDIQATALLFEAFKQVGIELIDHIIVAPDGVYSMDENGMMPRH